jgi:hypothetical protein
MNESDISRFNLHVGGFLYHMKYVLDVSLRC